MKGSNNLGINGKSIHAEQKSSAGAGYVQIDSKVSARMNKYSLQKTAQKTLFKHGAEMKEQHRTCWCHRGVASASNAVTIYRQTSGESARMHGVTTCKSVWTCPVCSAKICAVRQAELAEGMKNWVAQGGYTWLMTLTFPHEREMPLKETLAKFTKARQSFKNSRTYKRILAKNIRKGSVASLEVTVGDHGWHPHTHDLVFATPEAFGEVTEQENKRLTSALIAEMKAAWYTALLKAGLCEPHQMNHVLDHGLDIRGGQYAAEYIAKFGKEQKWGLSREVTMHAAKTGSDNKGAHPFQLLAWASAGDGQAAEQFREFAEAFEGKRMLTWSPGLKKELTGLDEISDEEAADMEMPQEESVGHIDSEALAVLQSRSLLPNFLGYVAQYCVDLETAQADIDAYIQAVREMPRTSRGEVKVKMWSRGFMHVDQEKAAA
jgi:hypothetical protein